MSLNLVPMIDVVFQLLMYFLLTTNFGAGEHAYELRLRGSTTESSDPFAIPQRPVTITIDDAGPAGLSLRLDSGLGRVSDFEAMEDALAGALYSASNPRGFLTADTPIVIRAVGDARWEHIVEAMNAALRAGYSNVQLAGAG